MSELLPPGTRVIVVGTIALPHGERVQGAEGIIESGPDASGRYLVQLECDPVPAACRIAIAAARLRPV